MTRTTRAIACQSDESSDRLESYPNALDTWHDTPRCLKKKCKKKTVPQYILIRSTPHMSARAPMNSRDIQPTKCTGISAYRSAKRIFYPFPRPPTVHLQPRREIDLSHGPLWLSYTDSATDALLKKEKIKYVVLLDYVPRTQFTHTYVIIRNAPIYNRTYLKVRSPMKIIVKLRWSATW